jgi:hypothetical protein
MLPFGVTIPATVPQRSEIQEELMNYPVLLHFFCAVLYYLWPVCSYYIAPHYVIKDAIFGEKFVEHELCVAIFCTNLSEKFLIPIRIQQDIDTY